MSITEKLLKLDPTLKRYNEGHWNEDLKDVNGYTSFNDAGLECETGEFLYAMTRILKPEHVLETGTHWGIGASYIGMALKDNLYGRLDTLEFLPEIHQRAEKRIYDLGLLEYVNCYLIDARAFSNNIFTYQLILLDTEPQTRFEELIKYYPSLEPGGFVFIHDLHRHMHQIPNEDHGFAWPYGKLPDQIKKWVKADKLRPFHFSTPRGLTGFYKPRKDDYVF